MHVSYKDTEKSLGGKLSYKDFEAGLLECHVQYSIIIIKNSERYVCVSVLKPF